VTVRQRLTTSHRRWSLALATAGMLVACGKSSTTPSGTPTVTSFEGGATASDGTTAVAQSGAPPVASGGPSITVTAASTVVAGTNTIVRVQSTQPFATVFAFVDGVDGFLKLSLSAPTTDTTLVVNLASNIPNATFTADYRVAAQSGAVGISATVPTVASPTVGASANITGTWALAGTPVVTFSQSGANVTGNEIFQSASGFTFSSSIVGTVSGSVFTGVNKIQISGSSGGAAVQCSETDGAVLQISGTTMTGTYTTGTLTCNIPTAISQAPLPFTITLTKQ
jgi:hypothetical protein